MISERYVIQNEETRSFKASFCRWTKCLTLSSSVSPCSTTAWLSSSTTCSNSLPSSRRKEWEHNWIRQRAKFYDQSSLTLENVGLYYFVPLPSADSYISKRIFFTKITTIIQNFLLQKGHDGLNIFTNSK